MLLKTTVDAYTQAELGDLEDQTASSNLHTSIISNQSDNLFDDETPYDQEEEQDDNYFFTSSTNTDCEDLNVTENTERKYIILKYCIGTLLKYCPHCRAIITEQSVPASGSMLSIKLLCIHGHETLWNSHSLINNTSARNLLIASSIFFSSSTFAHINEFCSCLNLKFISKCLFYDIQDKYLYPILNSSCEQQQLSVMEEARHKELVNLCGDARCDSPGHNAKYGTYTMMGEENGKVISFSLVQVNEVTSYNAMERKGFKRCIDEIQNQGQTIHRIAINRHLSISSDMNKKYKDIKHQFDIWHVAKSVVKKLPQKIYLLHL